MIAVVAVALVAALLYALSDFFEQRAASRAASEGALRRMVRDKVWGLGWALGTVAYLVQAVALRLGSVALVQSLQVTTLLFSLRLSTVGRPERAGRREYAGGAAICAGLALFLVLRGDVRGSGGRPDRPLLLLLLGLCGVVVAVLYALSRLRRGAARAVLLALAAGTALGCGGTLVKLTTTDLTTRGVLATATDWPGYAVAVATALGMVLQQVAFASGRLPTATTAMVVANPLVGTLLAVIGFRESLPSSPLRLLGIAAGGVLIAVGVTVLAHSPLLHGSDARATADREPCELAQAS